MSELVAALRVVPGSAGSLARRRPWFTLPLTLVLWVAAIKAMAPLWDWILGGPAGLDLHTRLGESVRFFFYDTAKIALLLVGIGVGAGILEGRRHGLFVHYTVRPDALRDLAQWLGSTRG